MSSSPNADAVSQHDFATQVLERSQKIPVLVDFWAAWCGPCQMLTPILARLAEDYQGKFFLAQVNTDEQQALAQQYGVRSLPTVKVFKQGKVVDEFMGVQPESAIRQIIERHIERPADQFLAAARGALAAGDAPTALTAVEHGLKLDPDNTALKIMQARAFMQTGAVEDAERILNALPLDQQLEPDVKQIQAQIGFARIATGAARTEELELRLKQAPEDLETRYQLAARRILAGDYESALENLFEIMRRDRRFRDDAGRKGLLAVFELVGGRGELVTRYRAKMFNALH